MKCANMERPTVASKTTPSQPSPLATRRIAHRLHPPTVADLAKKVEENAAFQYKLLGMVGPLLRGGAAGTGLFRLIAGP